MKEQGAEGDGNFDPKTGEGHVPARPGDYDRARAQGYDVQLLLLETFGGAGPGVMRLLRKLSDEVSNRLSHAQYDQTSWSARNWRTYQTQRLSVVLQLGAVEEIMRELGLAAGRAVDPGDQRAA